MWHSKDDVLNDLAQCTGMRMNDFDDEYIVRGSRPPPPLRLNECDDEEFNLRFGGCGDHNLAMSDENYGPNLAGITHMLRMVDTFNKPPEEETDPPPTNCRNHQTIVIRKPVSSPRPRTNKSKIGVDTTNIYRPPGARNPQENSKQTVIVDTSNIYRPPGARNTQENSKQTVIVDTSNIYRPPGARNTQENSKQTVIVDTSNIYRPPGARNTQENPKQTVIKSQLNPAVKEFVPRSLQIEDKDKKADQNENTNAIVNNKLGCNTKAKSDTDNAINAQAISNDSNSETDRRSDQEETQKMVALLKSKITSASKKQTQQQKLERNVAMVALSRLYSKPLTLDTKSSTSSTPRCVSPSMNVLSPSINVLSPPSETKSPKMVLMTPDYFAGPSCSPTIHQVNNSEQDIPKTPLETPSPQEINDPEVKKSIDKVNNWLNSPVKKSKPKKSVPHIGPIMFKKRDSVRPRSPSRSVSKKAETTHVIPSYVPSKYAEELAKDLESRAKAKREKELQNQPQLNVWEKLEMDLKARDELIKERANRSLDANDSQTSQSTSPNSDLQRI